MLPIWHKWIKTIFVVITVSKLYRNTLIVIMLIIKNRLSLSMLTYKACFISDMTCLKADKFIKRLTTITTKYVYLWILCTDHNEVRMISRISIEIIRSHCQRIMVGQTINHNFREIIVVYNVVIIKSSRTL